MRTMTTGFQQLERRLISERKPMLPVHAGEARYQAALDGDRRYREMVLASFALALVAGSSFGQTAESIGPVRSALLCVAAAGFGLRAIALRFPRPREASSLIEGPTPRLIAVAIVGFGALGSMFGGTNGLFAFALVMGASAVVLASTVWPKLRTATYLFCSLGLVSGVGWLAGSTGSQFSPVQCGIGVAIALLAGGISVFTNCPEASAIQPAMLLTSLAAYAWVILTVRSLSISAWAPAYAVLACGGLALIERAISVRSSFAPIVVLLVLIHLSGFLNAGANSTKALAPQMIVLLLEFCLIGMAGYRHALASLARYPMATYRSSPQCLVPTLDHAWEHPLKIDAT